VRTYNQIKEEVGYVASPGPAPNYVWYAYKEGVVLGQYPTAEEAKKHSKVVDKVQTNKAECDEHYNRTITLSRKVNEIFDKELREEYSDLSDKVYALCYSEAWDRGHAWGLDEVASIMQGVINFAESILKAD